VKTTLYIVGAITFCFLAVALSYWISDAVVNGDLSPFWKWAFLH
jgi:lipopolysaccharide export LptBFGC system permease protein LptF